MHVAAAFALLGIGGLAYFMLIGAATARWLLPWRWRPVAPAVAPLLGWAVVTAVAYPLNAFLPARPVLLGLGAVGIAALLVPAIYRRLQSPSRLSSPRPHTHRPWRPRVWAACVRYAPLGIGCLSYTLGTIPYVRAGSLSTILTDSDVEHYADVATALLHYPIGWTLEAHQGLDATPIGLGSHYAHATLNAISGLDAFSTAVPSLLLLLAMAPAAVYVFARTCLGAGAYTALLASTLFALSGTPLGVAAFGWRQQTAAIAALPIALAGVAIALRSGDRRSVLCGGLLAALGACSLYLASAPIVGSAAVAYTVWLTLRPLVQRHSAHGRTVSLPVGSAGALARPIRRLLTLGSVVAAAAFFSHLSALGYLLGRSAWGGLRPDDLAGRSTHVTTVASAAATLGVVPLDLFGAATTLGGESLVQWRPLGGDAGTALIAASGALLAAAGLVKSRRRPAYVTCVLLAVAGFELYLRVLRPFPYGEFKLLTTTWFLVPALAAVGTSALLAGVTRAPTGLPGISHPPRARTTVVSLVAAAGALVFAVGLLATRAHVGVFVALPWGAALPEREMAAAREIAAVPPRGAAVWVSSVLAPDAAVQWQGVVTAHRAGFPSREAGASSLASRWRGVVTALLAFGGRAPYGAVQRYSTELRLPLDPLLADYLLLDISEDPRLFGLLEDDRVASAGRLRLYRQVHRPALTWESLPLPNSEGTISPHLTLDRTLAAAASAIGEASRSNTGAASGAATAPAAGRATAPTRPAPVLPIGETSPGRRTGATILLAPPLPPRTAAAPPDAPVRVWLGIFSPAEREVTVSWSALDTGSGAGGRDGARRLTVFPGLTWYSPPPLSAPSNVRLDQAAGSAETHALLVAALAGPDSTGGGVGAGAGETLERSVAGVDAPLVIVGRHIAQAGSAGGTDFVAAAALPAADPRWLIAFVNLTRDLATTTSRVQRGGTLWLADESASDEIPLDPSAHVRVVTLRRVPPGIDAWLWFSVGAPALPALHEPAVFQTTASSAAAPAPPGAHSLPLLSRPAPRAVPRDGVLVKGASDRLHYVEQGGLRWVSSLETLTRRGINAPVVALPDVELWRLPVGLPLD